MSKKLLLFDVDGTLVKLDGAGLRALDKTFFKIFGIKDAVYKVNFYGKTDPKIYEDIMTIANLPLKLLDEKKKEIYEKYIYHLKYEISIFPHNPVITNVIEYLEKITNNDNYIIGLLTGNIEAGAYIKIGRWDLTKYF
ncbi:MAG TPA: HAD hydrolase-like protein, partial [bacterium]|nr:HAD hydrolase-like protein [bacterium]